MKSVCYLIANTTYWNDPRCSKMARSSAANGFDTTVCYISHTDECYTCNDNDIKLVHVKLPFNKIVTRAIKSYKNKKQSAKKPTFFTYALMFLYVYIIAQIYFYVKIRHIKASIYHANDITTLLTGALLKLTNGGKLVYDSHEIWTEMIDDHPAQIVKLVGELEKFLVKYADAKITVNELIANELAKKWGTDKPITILNVPYTLPLPEHKPHDKIRIIYQGLYQKDRGLELLIQMANGIHAENIEFYFRGIDVYGDGKSTPYLDKLRRLNSRFRGRVRFLEPVPASDLVSGLAGFDIGIIPYKAENKNIRYSLPNKLFEYMMAGLAVLSTEDLVCIKHIVEKCGCGYTYVHDDINDFYSKLVELSFNLAEAKRNARSCATATYNWDVHSRVLVDLYNRIIAS